MGHPLPATNLPDAAACWRVIANFFALLPLPAAQEQLWNMLCFALANEADNQTPEERSHLLILFERTNGLLQAVHELHVLHV